MLNELSERKKILSHDEFFSIAIQKVEVTWERIKKKQSVCNKAELKTDTMLKQPKKKPVHFLI